MRMSELPKLSAPVSSSCRGEPLYSGAQLNDRDDQHRLRQIVRAHEAQLETILEKIGQGFCLFDGSKRLILANGRYAELYGIAPQAIQPGMTLQEIIALREAAGSSPKGGSTRYLEWREQIATTDKPLDSVVELLNGRTIRIHHEPLPDSGWVSTHDDVTDERRSEEELRRRNLHFHAAIANMPQGLAMFDVDERMIVCNDNYLTLFGMSSNIVRPGISLYEILQHSVDIGIAREAADELYKFRRPIIAEGRPRNYAETLVDGRIIDIRHGPMDEGGWVSTYEDITERRQAEDRIAFMATHDTLTGLPNRAFFNERLSQMSGAEDRSALMALLLIDLDRFKFVNDTFGHIAGDKLLCLVAKRLRRSLRDADFAARLGGDEFAVILSSSSFDEASAAARRIIDSLIRPYRLDGNEANIGASIGISVAPCVGADVGSLLKSADLALYQAKSQGRGGFAFFESETRASEAAHSTPAAIV
jgi:diguanylate cyclase (GGDEF)-like protein